jgi:hypothetical protein
MFPTAESGAERYFFTFGGTYSGHDPPVTSLPKPQADSSAQVTLLEFEFDNAYSGTHLLYQDVVII